VTVRRGRSNATAVVVETVDERKYLFIPGRTAYTMEPEQSTTADTMLSVRNVGGIAETTVEFTPGVTVLVGRNATNRTSFLQAVMAALGSENVSIKGDAEEAEVELVVDDETFTRRLERRAGGIATTGEPYLDDPELADLFAFLLESNAARRAVVTNADLRELIMRPVDTDAIQAEIDRLVSKRESMNDELEEIEELKGRLPGLEERRNELRDRIEAKADALAETEAELETTDAEVAESREEQSALEEKLAELRTLRSRLDDVRYDLETERESLDVLTQERNGTESELAELPDAPVGRIEEIDAEIRRLRDQKQRLEAEVNELQSIIGFNEELSGDADSSAFADLADAGSDGEVTEQLLEDDLTTCWTCGTEVEVSQIEATVDRLRELSQTAVGEVNELDGEIEELRSEKREYERARRERERLEDRCSELETEISRTDARVETLQERRETLTAEIESVEGEVEALEDESHSAVLELHKEANQFEYELGKLETELERVTENIEEIENRIAEEAEIENRLETVSEDLEGRRERIERIEADAVETFNEHMETVLELLDYRNLDRIWIESVEREARNGRRTVTEDVFQLHVVRSSESGVAYEDTVDHLSESEREVTGLVFALAGYLAHEVYDVVPFMLLDSLEAIDSERIATLVEHFTTYTDHLLVPLLPEDAAALDEDYERITEI
jgi:DNA repair exonuclease SbcCD ATPase subunit